MTDDTTLTHAAAFDDPAETVTQVSPLVRRIVCDNPGPFTFTGTCTYIVGRGAVAIIDPGPENDAHLAALLDAVKGERVRHIVLTHTHRDHSPAARALAERTGADIVGCAPYVAKPGAPSGLDSAHDTDYAPARILGDGDLLEGDGFTLEAIATPGHASNHLAFALREENALFSGDHVMAWSTSIVAPPDGSMTDYMASLDKLRARSEAIYWPGHGGPVTDPAALPARALASPPAARDGDPQPHRRRRHENSRHGRAHLRKSRPAPERRRRAVRLRAYRGSRHAGHFARGGAAVEGCGFSQGLSRIREDGGGVANPARAGRTGGFPFPQMPIRRRTCAVVEAESALRS